MSSSEVAIRVKDVSKGYQIYSKPGDRLKQFLVPKFLSLFGQSKHRQYFKDFWAIKNTSFVVKKGETVGIIGRNGCGKSTLLQLVCGTLTPSSGCIEVNGRVAALLELGSGFNPEFSGIENVYLNASVLGLSNSEINKRLESILEFADIGEFIDQPVKTYSSGMMVRLAFAVIAHVDADILIIDEALAVGDAFFTQKCMRFLREFMVNGTVLFVSHDTVSVQGLCSKAIWLDHGELKMEGSPKQVCENYLEAFFESVQGESSQEIMHDIQVANLPVHDQRLMYVNHSNLRNDLEIFQFSNDASSFGKGGAVINDVYLSDEVGRKLSWVVGGEKVSLQIKIKVFQSLSSPIVGFFVRDRLGQNLFGDNTFLAHQEGLTNWSMGDEVVVSFVFNMPLLPKGDYSITVAIADGTQELHEQHHWIHDALIFRSESSSVTTGLVGIPMHLISVQKK